MKVIAGLGNPGERYLFTRHNAGFMVVDRFFSSDRFEEWILKRNCLIAHSIVNGEVVYLCKPLTYMNNSGIAVVQFLEWLKACAGNLIVVYDDIDLPFGMIRIRSRGGSGGHKGIESVIYHLQSEGFPRLRIGIGPKPEGVDLRDYVLSEFTDREMELLDGVLDRAVDALRCILNEGLERAMQKFNKRVRT